MDAETFITAEAGATSDAHDGCLTPPPPASEGPHPQKVPPHFPRHDGLGSCSFTRCLDRNACALANPCNFSLEVFGSSASWPGQPSPVHPRSSAGTLTAIPAPCCPAHHPLFSQPPAGPLLRQQITCRGLSAGWVYWAVLQENMAQTAPLQPKQSVIFNSLCHLIRCIARVTVKKPKQQKNTTSETQNTMFPRRLLRL